MPPSLPVRCPHCGARIKASCQLLGQSRPCPGCGKPFLIQLKAPPESGPMLIVDDRRLRVPARR